MIKVIKSRDEYAAAVDRIRTLVEVDPDPGTPAAEELGVLTVLVQDYESKSFPIRDPDPIEAIQFRMEQQNLSQSDLVPYIGSRSKVSEVLSRKRPLTLSMIRALHDHLGIPARVLLQGRDPSDVQEDDIEWEKFPIREMIDRGWINEKIESIGTQAERILKGYFAQLPSSAAVVALYRKTNHIRSARTMDNHALAAWTARIVLAAKEQPSLAEYKVGTVTLAFMQEIARLSWSENGPLLAREFLAKHGIPLIIEPQLSRTYLDGAAILVMTNRPIIGLTLRHDRIDNFWFSLMHECAHIALHMNSDVEQFYDDLDIDAVNDSRESEADRLAGEALIPQTEWRRSPASKLRSVEAVEQLAKKLRIHPAIVAGRIRHDFNSYRVLNNLIGHGQVRSLFPEVKWQ